LPRVLSYYHGEHTTQFAKRLNLLDFYLGEIFLKIFKVKRQPGKKGGPANWHHHWQRPDQL
jgi:hypothetical protein